MRSTLLLACGMVALTSCRGTHPDPGAAPAIAAPGAPRRGWELVLEWLEGEKARFAADLAQSHGLLLARARAEAPALIARLEPETVRPQPSGYQVLPELKPDGPEQHVSSFERRYELSLVGQGFQASFRDAHVLRERARAEPQALLEPLISEYERLRASLLNLEEHLAYHAQWQRAVVDWPEWFSERNQVLELVRRRAGLSAGEILERAQIEREIGNRLAPFRPTHGLVLRELEAGRRVLPVRVDTDVDDADFLDAFRAAVERHWNQATAARERGFEIALELRRVDPGAFYPEGAPTRGAAIDAEEHAKRFPEGALVLTTGARSLHSFQGRSILLGPNPVSPRELAHEFGHFLGFGDAYLRAFEGSSDDRCGAVLIECIGLFDDLMGNPGGGTVSAEMIEKLIEVYGRTPGG